MNKAQLKAILAKSDALGQPDDTDVLFQAANGDRTTLSGECIVERVDVKFVPNAQGSLDAQLKEPEALVLIQA